MMRRPCLAETLAVRPCDEECEHSKRHREKATKEQSDAGRPRPGRIDDEHDAEPRRKCKQREQADAPQIGGKRHIQSQKTILPSCLFYSVFRKRATLIYRK